jgi:hypothetical protein
MCKYQLSHRVNCFPSSQRKAIKKSLSVLCDSAVKIILELVSLTMKKEL